MRLKKEVLSKRPLGGERQRNPIWTIPFAWIGIELSVGLNWRGKEAQACC